MKFVALFLCVVVMYCVADTEYEHVCTSTCKTTCQQVKKTEQSTKAIDCAEHTTTNPPPTTTEKLDESPACFANVTFGQKLEDFKFPPTGNQNWNFAFGDGVFYVIVVQSPTYRNVLLGMDAKSGQIVQNVTLDLLSALETIHYNRHASKLVVVDFGFGMGVFNKVYKLYALNTNGTDAQEILKGVSKGNTVYMENEFVWILGYGKLIKYSMTDHSHVVHPWDIRPSFHGLCRMPDLGWAVGSFPGGTSTKLSIVTSGFQEISHVNFAHSPTRIRCSLCGDVLLLVDPKLVRHENFTAIKDVVSFGYEFGIAWDFYFYDKVLYLLRRTGHVHRYVVTY